MKFVVCVVVLASLYSSSAFNSLRTAVVKGFRVHSSAQGDYDDGNMLNGLKAGLGILRKGLTKGDGFKQSLADALAGPELDLKAANDRIDAYISKSPVVVFSWTVSGFSKKAKTLLTSIGAEFEAVELDQPWSDGNPIRSALGRRVGRTSVPAIFINGVYIGGCDDGPSSEAPGLIPLAFQGKLRSMLIASGSMKADAKVDSGSGIESSSMVVKTVPATASPPSTNARDNVVSSTVSLNQKMSAPTDKVVSSTVADNLAKALASPQSKAVAAVVAVVAAATSAPVVAAATSTSVVATASVPVAAVAKLEGKAAKGFYSKKNVVVDDELCPVEEECEL